MAAPLPVTKPIIITQHHNITRAQHYLAKMNNFLKIQGKKIPIVKTLVETAGTTYMLQACMQGVFFQQGKRADHLLDVVQKRNK